MSAIKVFRSVEVPERSDASYRTRWKGSDPEENGIAGAAILSIHATLKRTDGTVLNSRSAQDVKNANGGTLAIDGRFVLQLGPADHVVDPDAGLLEPRILTLALTYTRRDGTVGGINREVRYFVRNLAHVS